MSLSSMILGVPSMLLSRVSRVRAVIYDAFLLHLTAKWYETVLKRLEPNSTVLDVGIGTAGALIRCQSILRDRNIRVVGLDYDETYVTEAQNAISKEGLDDYVSVIAMSVYDAVQKRKLLSLPGGSGDERTASSASCNKSDNNNCNDNGDTQMGDSGWFDAVYFSGSFSLLPDMTGALNVVSNLLKPVRPKSKIGDPLDDDNKNCQTPVIYITQTYQRRAFPFLAYIKPILKYATTIDFGKLVTEQDAVSLYYGTVQKECDIKVVEHSIISGSVDSMYQAAYLTVLQPTMPTKNIE